MILSKVCGAFIHWIPSELDAIFATGFIGFRSMSGCHGLAKEDEDARAIEVLAVQAERPGTGQFRRFVAQLKASYDKVAFIHELSPTIGAALERYGFRRGVEMVGATEVATVWRWER